MAQHKFITTGSKNFTHLQKKSCNLFTLDKPIAMQVRDHETDKNSQAGTITFPYYVG